MGRVTALQPSRGGAVALHVDGALVCILTEALAGRWGLREGMELDADDLMRLAVEAEGERALGDAYRLLQQRARSRTEIERRLLTKGHNESAVAGALDRLTAAGLLDDEDFARRYVADKRNLGGWGGIRIRRGLADLGVAEDVAEAALGAGEPAGDDIEIERALRYLSQRGAPQRPLEAAQRRAYQALLRKGFAAAVAYAAVRRWSEDLAP